MSGGQPKRLTNVLPRPFWRYGGEQSGYEYHNYPTERARRLFYHVRSIGEASPPAGFRHSHRDETGFLLHFLVRGQMWHRLNQQQHLARAAECCWMDLTAPVEYGNDGPGAARLFWVHLDGPLLPLLFRELNADLEPVFRGFDPAVLTALFRRLIRLTANQPPDYEPRASAQLGELLAELFACRQDALPLPDSGIDPARLSPPTRQALAMIARYYMQDKTIKGLAVEIGLSRSHFARLFHRETGFTPSDYLHRYRLEVAARLLSTSDTSIHQIARSVGIPNVENFSKQFRRRYRLGPRAYRNRARRPAAPKPSRSSST